MIDAVGTAVVQASGRDVLEFVADLEQYRQADPKIGRVQSVERRGKHEWTARYRGWLGRLPGPKVAYLHRMTPWRRLDVESLPGAMHLVYRFTGSFECEETPEGTKVTHRETLHTRRPFSWLLDPLLGPWFRGQIHPEMERLKELVEAGARRDG